MTDKGPGIHSPGSTIAASDLEERTGPSSPISPSSPPAGRQQQQTPPPKRENGHSDEEEVKEVVPTPKPAPMSKSAKSRAKQAAALANPANNNSSLYSGNKVRHLKKDDGEPLWRKDIQYDFLRLIFDDDTECFQNSYEPWNKQNFANLYIDAMARSSKTSKILRDKLLSEHEPAKNMAMVCLLVNLGRMNTTLNFFPEMRAQLRTYHAIPSLQAHQDPNSYKQLQDAPRLKSILKGASEDRPEPNTIEKIKETQVPRTNPVNLIFVLSQYAPKITELHFPPGRDFYDLIMRPSLSSKSRARAFLWLMWHYLESDFTEEGAEENPFGSGVDYGTNVANQGVPRLEQLDDDQVNLENVDTPEEIEYGEAKMRERKRIIEADQAAFQAEYGPPKRGPKPKLNLPPDEGTSPAMFRTRPSKYESDVDSTRSTPPPRGIPPNMRIQSVLSGPRARGGAPIKHQMVDSSSPAPSGFSNNIIAADGNTRRARPLTAHQLAVEHNRNQRVNYILSRGLRKVHHQARKARRTEGAILRAVHRTAELEDMYEDSESEDNFRKSSGPFMERGFGGLVQLSTEEDDFGEELSAYAAAFRRMGRRLDRWDGPKGPSGVVGTNRIAQAAAGGDETEDEKPAGEDRILEEDLDDMDKEILGLGSEAEGEDEDLDDVDKALLGINGDETEEELSDGGMDID